VSLILVHSERFADHQTPPGHPERPERAEVFDAVASRWRDRGVEIVAPRTATREQLGRVHDAEYLRMIAETNGQSVRLDPDTYTSPESYEVALLGAGAGIDAVERVLNGSHRAAIALVRPPGHHAERSRAMGFCLYNNAAIAAAHARAEGGARKVAVVDYDVHHGNGTQHIFDADPHVLYLSTHQFPFYPGTGAATEIGHGAGQGFTVNLPFEAGAVAEDFRVAIEAVAVPVLNQFEPDLLIISAGYDAHEHDPLGGLRLTADVFGAMTMALRQVAEHCCRGRVVVLTEGGYDLKALGASLNATIEAFHGPLAAPAWPSSGIASTRGEQSVRETHAALRAYWHFR
jgi:acetoin utilization deacetylase AcuC-like enzyme